MQHHKRGIVLLFFFLHVLLLCLTYRTAPLSSPPPRLASPFTLRPFERSIRVPALYPKPYTAGELRPSLDLTACRLPASQKSKLCANSLTVAHAVLSQETILPLIIHTIFTVLATPCEGSGSNSRLRAKPCLYKMVTHSPNLSLNPLQMPEAAVKPDVGATSP